MGERYTLMELDGDNWTRWRGADTWDAATASAKRRGNRTSRRQRIIERDARYHVTGMFEGAFPTADRAKWEWRKV